MGQKRAIVIIPTYNERENIERTLEAVLKQAGEINEWQLLVLVVDDTSPDKTYEVVRRIGQKNPAVNLLMNAKKSGLGGAYLKGMEYAFTQLKADAVFEFDADLSHDPTKIPLFLAEIDKGAQMVLGTRYKNGGSIPADWGFHRKFLSVVGNLTIMFVLGNFAYRDWTSGYRAITKEVYQKVSPKLVGDQFSGYTFQIGFLYYAHRLGFRIVESVPYHFIDRTIGESKIGPEYLKNTLMFIFKMRLSEIKHSKFLKFALVGGIGALVQLISLKVFSSILPGTLFLLAFFLSIEMAVVSNFIFNNFWTFADSKLQPSQIPLKFLIFNFSSFGSILIQMSIASLGYFLIGVYTLFSLFMIGAIDTGMIFAVVGIGLGMLWNYFAYNKFVWNKKTPHV